MQKCDFGHFDECDPKECINKATQSLTSKKNGHIIANEKHNPEKFALKKQEIIATISLLNQQIDCAKPKINGSLFEQAEIDFESKNDVIGLGLGEILTGKEIIPVEKELLENLKPEDMKNKIYLEYELPSKEGGD